MNRKHIAQALSRKVDDWISNINNEENKQTSEDILDVIIDYTGNGDDEQT